MAESVVTLSSVDKWSDGKRQFMTGFVNIAAGDYSTGGIAFNMRTFGFRGTKQPSYVGLGGVTGYLYEYYRANNKLLIRQQTDPAAGGGANVPLVELGATATPAGVVADKIQFFAVGSQLI
jgi:hypothetical protein